MVAVDFCGICCVACRREGHALGGVGTYPGKGKTETPAEIRRERFMGPGLSDAA